MIDLKEKVYEIVQNFGPVLPVQVSQKINTNILIASALLSELVGDKKVRFTGAKIGTSPLYYIEGQEPKLEILHYYLPSKEKEAYKLLKEKKIIKDYELEPAIRVAFNNLKDFAIPVYFENVLYWRWYLSNDVIPGKKVVKIETKIVGIPKVNFKKEVGSQFKENILKHFVDSGIELVDEVRNLKKEFVSVSSFDSKIGKLVYLVYAKDKKKISESDLSLAYNKGLKFKLPVIFLSTGDLSKKSQKYLNENLKGYVLFRRL